MPGVTWMLWLVVAVVAAYLSLWLLGQGPLAHVYTAEWTSRRIPWLYAPVTLLLALAFRSMLPAALSILGLVVGAVVGELVGAPVLAAQEARVARELATGVLRSWEPAHPGWWIASIVFVALSAVGARIGWRRQRAPAPTIDTR